MNANNPVIVTVLASVMGLTGLSLLLGSFRPAVSQAEDAGQPAIAKRIGTIKGINRNAITLAADSGPDVVVTVSPTARILRLAPGDKDLKNAATIQLQDLQVGDTIRARGQASDDGKSISGLEIIVITHSAVAAVRDEMSQDWQKRGVAGPVTAVDAGAGSVTISTSSFGAGKTMVVRTSKATVVRRYAPDSAKFEDAKLSTLEEIQVGDQLRARGNHNADGSELAAEEIATGTFPRIAGLIKSVDAGAGTLSLQDLSNKKTVQLKVTADSQLHKIPAEMAQRLAMRVKAVLPPGTPGRAANSSSGSYSSGVAGQSAPAGAPSRGTGQGDGGPGGGPRAAGGFDFQRLLDQTPAVTLADLHKGDALLVLATQGTPAGGSTVLKLFSGVEPILEAAPNGSQAMMLAPWTLGGVPGGDAGSQ